MVLHNVCMNKLQISTLYVCHLLLSLVIEDSFQDKYPIIALWVDLEKAFDMVSKDGLCLKLQKYGVRGSMYKCISQCLLNRNARVQMDGSRKKVLSERVPQGGVPSPNLIILEFVYEKKYVPFLGN